MISYSVDCALPLPYLHRRQCWKRGAIHLGTPIPHLAPLHTNLGGQARAASIRGQGVWTGAACWPCGAVSGSSSEAEAWPSLEEPVGRGDPWAAGVARREWPCLRTDAQGREHLSLPQLLLLLGPDAMILVSLVCFVCCPLRLCPLTPTLGWGQKPHRWEWMQVPIGRSKRGLTVDLWWQPRVQNLSCVWHELHTVSSVLGSPASPVQRHCTLQREPSCHRVPLLELRPTRVPRLHGALGQCQTGMKWGTWEKRCRLSLSTSKERSQDWVLCQRVQAGCPSRWHHWPWAFLTTIEGIENFEEGVSGDQNPCRPGQTDLGNSPWTTTGRGLGQRSTWV